ncbi:MAG: outer membrane protein [Xanthobacteraceae bacterium]|jgi:outer membrane immunogenic protein
MKRLSFATITFAAIAAASASFAADLPAPAYKVPAMAPAPIYNWTGFYIGVEGGWGFGRADQTDPGGFNSGTYNVNGGLIGGTLGYNWQMGQAVFGLEGDGSYSWIKGSTAGTLGGCGGAPPNCSSNLQALGTFRGRLGWAIDRVLPYVTGGLAVGSLHGAEGDVAANGAFGSGSTTVAGWTVGGGVEVALAPNWSAKVEYLHVDLGNQSIFNDTFGGAILPESIKFTTEIVRGGVNFKF